MVQPDEIVPGDRELLRLDVSGLPRRLRIAREDARGPSDQARGQSGPSGEPGRALRARPGVDRLDLPPRPLQGARASATPTARYSDDLVGRGDRAARRARSQKAGGRTWLLGGETGPTAGRWIDAWVTAVGAGGRVVYEPFAPEALRDARRRRVRRARRAGLRPLRLRLRDRLRFGLPRVGPVADRARAPARRPRATSSKPGARRRALRVRRPAALDDGVERRRVDRGAPGQRGARRAGARARSRSAPTPARSPGSSATSIWPPVAKQADVPVATLERVGKALGAAKAPVADPAGCRAREPPRGLDGPHRAARERRARCARQDAAHRARRATASARATARRSRSSTR